MDESQKNRGENKLRGTFTGRYIYIKSEKYVKYLSYVNCCIEKPHEILPSIICKIYLYISSDFSSSSAWVLGRPPWQSIGTGNGEKGAWKV